MGHSPGSPALSSPLVARHRLPRNHRLVAHSGSRLDQVVLRPAAALRRPIPPNCLCPHCPGPKPATVSLQKRITTETQSGEAAKNLTTETPRHREEADEADSSWGEKTFELSSTEKKGEKTTDQATLRRASSTRYSLAPLGERVKGEGVHLRDRRDRTE